MPIILIIVGVIAALGLGSFVLLSKPDESTIAPETPVARAEDTTSKEISSVSKPEIDPEPETDTTPEPVTTQSALPAKPVTTAPKLTPAVPVAITAKTAYKNGTYTVTTSYVAPSRTTHEVVATVKILNDVVTEAQVSYGGEPHQTSSQYQSRFSQSYQSQVVGKKLDSISLSRVGGASLTTGAFNKALVQVKTQAR